MTVAPASATARPTLLLLRHNALGDLVTALPAIRGLRRAFPHHRLVMTCPSWLRPLAEACRLADTYIDESAARESDVLHDPSDHHAVDDAILNAAVSRAGAADVLVSLRVPDRVTTERLRAVGPRVFIGFQHPELPDTATLPAFSFQDHITERWRRLLAPFGVRCDDADLRIDFPSPTDPTGTDCTLVHAGAAGEARRWPQERWAEVATALEQRGHRVVLTGSRAEGPVVRRVLHAAGLPADRDLSGATGILDLVRLVSGARLVLSSDTGVFHLAVALDRPTVTLFGPVPPAWWGPLPGRDQHRVLWKGRFGHPYDDEPHDGLLAIGTEEVLGAAADLDRRQGHRSRTRTPALSPDREEEQPHGRRLPRTR